MFRRSFPVARLLVATALTLVMVLPAAGQDPIADCGTSTPHSPSSDLYCMTLVEAAGIPGTVRGRVLLDPAASPFTVPVTVDGIQRYRARLQLQGLPAPETLDPAARTYVAWVATPMLTHWQKLGEVRNGETAGAGVISFEQFLVIVSAEPSADVTERTGRLVLRAGSATTRLHPPDVAEMAVGLLSLTQEELASLDHAHHGSTGSSGWTTVPMPEGIAMPAAEMLLRPGVSPQLPGDDGTAPMVRRSEVVALANGDTLELTAGTVRKRIHGREHVLYGFNGQIPGPVLKVERGTSITVRFHNRLDQPSTIHWHGLRHDYRMDGVPELSQEVVQPGESFDYTLQFPDGGLYWYHPHVREEMQQDLGLSGNIMVSGMAHLPPVDREELLLLDDMLIGDDGLVPFGVEAVTHALMGRFGNVMLVNGEPLWHGSAKAGETVRFWLTNAANTRTFNLSFTNATMRVVAGDMGAYDRRMVVESVVLAPAERYAVDVTFRGGESQLLNRVRALDHLYGRFFQQDDTLGAVAITGEAGSSVVTADEAVADVAAEHRAAVGDHSAASPDLILEFGLRTRDLPFVTERMMLLDSAYFHPVEWSGTMPMMNWATTALQAEWFVRDAATGQENHAAEFRVKRGEKRVIRLVNLRNSIHAMQHPVHVHGQRFLILAVNGQPPAARSWKDTVLLPAGGTVDILVEFTNPGHWMLHCHIAEHMEAGMMTTFVVE